MTKPRTARRGRPPKPADAKVISVTMTFAPAELERFEALRNRVNEGLPARVTRTDIARLAIDRLAATMTPGQIRKALAERVAGEAE